jgi:hypothetical protein
VAAGAASVEKSATRWQKEIRAAAASKNEAQRHVVARVRR